MNDGKAGHTTDGSEQNEQYAQFVFMVRALENRVQRDPHVPTSEVEQHVRVICDQAHSLNDSHPDLGAVCESLQSIKHLHAPDLRDRLHEITAKVNDGFEKSAH